MDIIDLSVLIQPTVSIDLVIGGKSLIVTVTVAHSYLNAWMCHQNCFNVKCRNFIPATLDDISTGSSEDSKETIFNLKITFFLLDQVRTK